MFPLIIILECFLHAFIKIRERGKHLKETFRQLSQKVWEDYHAIDAAAFRSQAAELLTWAESNWLRNLMISTSISEVSR